MKKNIIFILGSGRCGTYSFYKALNKLNNIECHHEFFFEPTLRIATLYHMGLAPKSIVKKHILNNHFFSIKNSKKAFWVDSSNALPWIADVLIEIFPNAKFIHLIRHGKKVVSSFYHKHNSEMYTDASVKKLYSYLNQIKKKQIFSSEKKYWRPIPFKDKKKIKNFLLKGQFYRICKYWSEINKKIENSLMMAKNSFFMKFEDVHNKKKLISLIKFLKLGNNSLKTLQDSFKKPVNVTIPKNFKLNRKQNKIFDEVCCKEMKKFKYSNLEYETSY